MWFGVESGFVWSKRLHFLVINRRLVVLQCDIWKFTSYTLVPLSNLNGIKCLMCTMKCLECTMNIFLVRFFGIKRHCGLIVFYDYFPLFVQIIISFNTEGYFYPFSVAREWTTLRVMKLPLQVTVAATQVVRCFSIY